jgi:hypothetical protein
VIKGTRTKLNATIVLDGQDHEDLQIPAFEFTQTDESEGLRTEPNPEEEETQQSLAQL